ncbi:helix-turn-helix transcriptional regulator [Acinetobacter nectaris]|uniref:helix-turn-helix transcriptional regulator n=1 Tax=Acinetobacter nectaris TaxID=1219382 RepID=UPI001F296FAC|nr:PAS domain-containing protein [Acinetobacter nectaris]MCF9046092.1 PAS domain-containing protein [Acinetobacter nectaris]
MSKYNVEEQHLLEQLDNIADGLSQTLQPFCEVVVHHLKGEQQGIHRIYNNLSDRKEGDDITALGQARIEDKNYPKIIANYANRLPNGKPLKSTSIGIKNKEGEYIAALCLNLDIAAFSTVQNMLAQFTAIHDLQPKENLQPLSQEELIHYIDQFSAKKGIPVRGLNSQERKQLMHELKNEGFLEIRRSIDLIAKYLGVSRPTIYSYLK